MTKPTKHSRETYDYSECASYLEKKHGANLRDFLNSHSQFGEWADAKGYGQTDPVGKRRSDSRIWYAEYQGEIAAGTITERPYQDFWHWVCNALNPHRGATITFSTEWLESCEEEWQRAILNWFLDEFGEGPEKECEFLTDW